MPRRDNDEDFFPFDDETDADDLVDDSEDEESESDDFDEDYPDDLPSDFDYSDLEEEFGWDEDYFDDLWDLFMNDNDADWYEQ